MRCHVSHVADGMTQTVFAVPMTCDSCVKDVSETLYKLQGIKKVEANLKDQLVSIEGTGTESRQTPTDLAPNSTCVNVCFPVVAPSAIVEAIQATGRDAILRGSGTSNSRWLPRV